MLQGACAKEVQELYEREGLTVRELKSSTLLRSSGARYEHVGHIASNNGVRVFMAMLEKRYQVCVMIVETHLDSIDRAANQHR